MTRLKPDYAMLTRVTYNCIVGHCTTRLCAQIVHNAAPPDLRISPRPLDTLKAFACVLPSPSTCTYASLLPVSA